ncbi:MAG: NAD-dependent epimerase/dehydratase family protein [Oscillibacter sp.]|nr:NAD-dependent epimerase/dehydratase family protein [uncultured Oscillibacter sp.]MCI8971891.1 NAD-dependent epimerase/dehydratase family protein [Oscillibacter sp.]
MERLENRRYLAMLDRLAEAFPHWDRLEGRCLYLSGAAGMLGCLLTDAVMRRNEALPPERRCRILAAGRNRPAAEKRFSRWWKEFVFLEQDVGRPLGPLPEAPDYWIHAASTTHPVAYATEPVNTILSNVMGARNLLDCAAGTPGSRFLLLSSVEIYGENRGDTETFTEADCGYLDCNTLRAGYPEAKRVSEALCQAYIAERDVDAVIIRLPRCYGPTMRWTDSKAVAQFIKKSVRGEDIVLKSAGNQLYSYAHAFDAVLGILWTLTAGETGWAYNLADRRSDIRLKDLAAIAAEHAGTKVVFDLPDETEKRGYSTAGKALLDGARLRALGWQAAYDIRTGIRETIDILRELDKGDGA